MPPRVTSHYAKTFVGLRSFDKSHPCEIVRYVRTRHICTIITNSTQSVRAHCGSLRGEIAVLLVTPTLLVL